MSTRPTLKPGQTIGVFAPSSYVEKEDIERSKALLERRGYKVFIHPQTYARHGQMAGTYDEKLNAINELWGRADIHALWAAGGGNRALSLLDTLDYSLIRANPKPLIGFSDVTALLCAVNAHTSLTTYHGPVFKELHKFPSETTDQCLTLLSGKATEKSLKGAETLNPGRTEGPLIGGCLSLFHLLVGTKDCPDLNGTILFLEDSGDHLSRFDRMLIHMERMGVFEQIGGLVFGEFLDLQEGTRPFGFSLDEIFFDLTKNLDIPVLANAPFGHGDKLISLPIGQIASLHADKKTLILK